MLQAMLFPNPGCWQPFYLLLLWGSIAGSCTTAPVSSAELFSVQLPPALTGSWVYSSPRTELCTSPCGIFVPSAHLLRVSWVQVMNGELKQCWSSLYPGLQPQCLVLTGLCTSDPSPGTLIYIQACSYPLLLPGPCFTPCVRMWWDMVLSQLPRNLLKDSCGSVRHCFLFRAMLTNTNHCLVHIMFGMAPMRICSLTSLGLRWPWSVCLGSSFLLFQRKEWHLVFSVTGMWRVTHRSWAFHFVAQTGLHWFSLMHRMNRRRNFSSSPSF